MHFDLNHGYQTVAPLKLEHEPRDNHHCLGVLNHGYQTVAPLKQSSSGRTVGGMSPA